MLPHAWRHIGFGMHHHPVHFGSELQSWMLMVAAMMIPLVVDSIRATAASSLWPRRHRGVAEFLLGLLLPWLALGFAAAALRQLPAANVPWTAALLFALAAGWQVTPWYRRMVNACHSRRPLAPDGWAADRDCLHFGASVGVAQVVSCAPLMLGCAFAAHGLIAMAAGLAIGALEHWPSRPKERAVLMSTLALSGYYVILGVSQ